MGTYVLLEALSRLRHRIPDCRLLLAGNGEVENVRSVARELGLDHSVEVPGWVGPVVKEQLLREVSVLALPSFAEALPMSLLEAMAHGVPVVATPVGAIPEIIDRWRCGVLVPVGDAGLLEEALVRLLDSAEIRQHMGRAGRQAYERDYRADVVVPRLDAIYEQLGAFRDVHARGDSQE